MARQFKVVVKDGDYRYNPKTGQYEEEDYIFESEEFFEAIIEFLNQVEGNDWDNTHKVTLVYRHVADKKKGKKN